MATTITFVSGKGGTGKSAVVLNLGLTLAQLGKKVIIVDADVAMANLALMLGIERAPINLHNVLMGENPIREAIYDGPLGLKYVPASLSIERYRRLDYDKLKDAIGELEKQADYVLIDSPPGIGVDAEAAMKAGKELILVVMPEPTCLADSFKVRTFAEKYSLKVRGFVSNMVLGDRSEIKDRDLETVLGVPLLASIPEDIEARRSTALQQPAVIRQPATPFSKGIRQLAAKLTGEKVAEPAPPRKGLFARLFGGLFGKKK
jgi:septum site-determining protein MinD